ncbi:hypothetical protein C2845_PM17G10100 [Panicum miliaceum]|uniref:Uncharacterized protein n=1 Tax=Panicum miliaceum TaxID=4540 RepID=A0A3L6Q3P7_PANMI|nr:hypothetical protein C2845_PM17G10100 [Panicum miliaceum]
MVDSITDAVESAIHRGNRAGGLRRYMLQCAIRRVLRDITDHRIHPRCSNIICSGGSGGRRPGPCSLLRPSSLQFAYSVCPTHGLAKPMR